MQKKSAILVASLMAASIFFGACSTSKTANQPDQSQPPGMEQPNPSGVPKMQIDYATAATKLGVTEDALKAALQATDGGRPDFAAAAKTLGVTETALQEALGMPNRPAGSPPPTK